VIFEPLQNTGGAIPPPEGYWARVREICDRYGVLLVSDEVICAFGRLGHWFGSGRYGYQPDIVTFAKGVTSGTVPMGGAIVRKPIYDAFMRGPDHVVELFHGYTYSAHPLACAASLGTLETYAEEGLLTRGAKMAVPFEHAVHSLAELPHVIDTRNIGLVGALELESIAGAPGKRAFDVFRACFERGVLIRTTGDTIALSPPLIIDEREIDTLFGTLGEVLDTVH
jgi:beta-alanine--pyruvate transaminase